MNRTVKNFLAVLLLITSNLLGGCAVIYSSDDVKGRIVDKATGEPIEGAVVVGIWQLESQGFEHSYGAAIHVVESVSDANGNYRLKGFDTKWVGPFRGELRDSDPYISVFAEGYRPGNAGSDTLTPLKHNAGNHRISPYNGRDIKLERGSVADWSIARIWNSSLRRIVNAGDCAVTSLTALRTLLENVEPQCDKILMKESGRHCSYYHDAIEQCEGDRKP